MSGRRLANRIGQGLAIDTALGIVLRALSLAVTVAVARILSEAEFGAVSIALSIFGIGETLTNPAIITALARRTDLPNRVVDVAWTLAVIRAFLLAAVMYGTAPLLVQLWGGEPSIVHYLRWLALGTLGSGLSNLHVVRFQRDLRFATAFLIDNSRVFFGIIGSLILLVSTRHAIALVLGPVMGNFVNSGLTWLFVAPRPRFAWSRAIAGELLAFGRWVMVQGILVYLMFTVDNLYVGHVLGLAALGAYALGWRIVNVLMTFLTRSLGQMLIPAYATLQNDHAALKNALVVAFRSAAILGVLAGACLLLLAPDLIALLAGRAHWMNAVPVARALTVFTLTRMLNNTLAPAFYSVGESRPVAIVSSFQLLVFGLALYIGARVGGITGVALGISLGALSGSAILQLLAAHRFGVSISAQVHAVVAPLAVVTPALAVGWLAIRSIQAPIFRLLLGAPLVVGTFGISWILLRRSSRFSRLLPDLPVPRSFRIGALIQSARE